MTQRNEQSRAGSSDTVRAKTLQKKLRFETPSKSSQWHRRYQHQILDICPSRLVTVGDCLFASAGPRAWNSLPENFTSAPSLPVFQRKLKTHLFRHSYPDIVTAPQWFLEVFFTIGHYKKLLCNVM